MATTNTRSHKRPSAGGVMDQTRSPGRRRRCLPFWWFFVFFVAIGLVSFRTSAAPAAEVYWRGVVRAAQAMEAERADGKAILDALEQRAKDALGKLDHPTDRAAWQKATPELRQRLATAVGRDRLPKPAARNVRQVGTL